MSGKTEFDQFAENYEENIGPMISLTGEDRTYFARERIVWLSQKLKQIGFRPRSLLDFGCGTGISAPALIDLLNLEKYLGVDVSIESLNVAIKEYGHREECQFMPVSEFDPDEQFDMVFTNGVFHHIPIDQRSEYVNYMYRALRPGGLLSFYEYNPLNPILLLGMKLSPVDRNAIPLIPGAGRKLLERGNFRILKNHFLFFFPKLLRCFRKFEPKMVRVPLGAQYVILARKPIHQGASG